MQETAAPVSYKALTVPLEGEKEIGAKMRSPATGHGVDVSDPL